MLMATLFLSLECDPENKLVVMEIYLDGNLLTMLNTLMKTSLFQIREDLTYEGIEDLPKEYVFTMDTRKVQKIQT